VRRRLFASAVLAAAAAAWAATGPVPVAAAPAARIVAIADVHGGYEPFVAILERTGLIDAQRKWTGGATVFVQTGDVTDRGAGVRQALDLLMALEPQAAAAGGRIQVLLGNHEVMNMLGNTRDATPEILASFGGEAAFREAFGPSGRYGKWLRAKPAIAKVDDTMFLHAGINPDATTDSIDTLNRSVRDLIAQWDAGVRTLVEKDLVLPLAPFDAVLDAAAAAKAPIKDILGSHLFHPDGLLWFRGYSQWTDGEGEPRVAALLKRYKVKRIVSGHTVQPSGAITQRFGGRILLIDTGMLDGKFFPGGRASALEIRGDVVTPLY
jgi:hypothetical protein